MHLVNLTAFRELTDDRKARLFRMAVASCEPLGRMGYHAGAFVLGSLLDPGAPATFWERLNPGEIAFLLNEWVQHQKYLGVLEATGEDRIARARRVILSDEFGRLPNLAASAPDFLPLKLSRVDLGEVRRAVPCGADIRTAELIDLVDRPYRELFDYGDRQSIDRLRRVCEAEGLPLPGPGDH